MSTAAWNQRVDRVVHSGSEPVADVTAPALTSPYSGERRLASQYRAALQGAQVKYLQSARVHGSADQVAGIVFAYRAPRGGWSTRGPWS